MEHIQVAREGALAIITMARGKANAINTAMARELFAAVQDACADGAVKGVVLASGRPKFFCAGFDIAEVFRYDREALTECFRAFGEMYEAILFCEKPVVAAMPGHAYAGGAIIALTADFRVMAEGDYGFALNEVNLGATLPDNVFRMLDSVAGTRQARRMLLTGAAVKGAELLRIGLVDEVTPADEVLARAKAIAAELAEKPAYVLADMKRVTRKAAGLVRSENPGPDVEPWFQPETIARKTAMLEALSKPKG